MKIGIVMLATNSYFVLGIRFIRRFMHFYRGNSEIKFLFFSNYSHVNYVSEHYDIEHIFVTNDNWTQGTNLKFKSILLLTNTDVSHIFFFDADTSINQEFTEEWFLGDSVTGQHYNDDSLPLRRKEGFESNENSTAFIPYNSPYPYMYYYGAFFGGIKEFVLKLCCELCKYQDADTYNGITTIFNDESYLNKYFHFNPPSRIVKKEDFKFVVSAKGGIQFSIEDTEHLKCLKECLLTFKYNLIDLIDGKMEVSE